jgi:hypothetical protein
MKGLEDGYSKWNEEEHQVAFFQCVDEQISGGNAQYVTLGAIPNGHGQVDGATLRRYRVLGFRVGIPDIYWYLARGKHHGMFIELKTMKRFSRPTGEQSLMKRILEKNEYYVECCHKHRNAMQAGEKYDVLQKDTTK